MTDQSIALTTKLHSLRAEIWEAAMIAQTEIELVQTLLNKLGPALNCENISFMPYDPDGKHIYVAQQWCANGRDVGLGEKVPTWIFKPYRNRPYIQINLDAVPAILKPVLKIFQNKYNTKSTLVVPYGNPDNLQGYITVNYYNEPHMLNEEEISLFIEMARIINLRGEQLQTQAKLQAGEARLRAFFNAISDAVFVHPFQAQGFGMFIEVNEMACRRYGYTREEFLQMTAHDITRAPDVAQHAKPDHRKQLREYRRYVTETIHIKKSGQEFPVEINANVIIWDDQEVIMAVVRDISDRKQAADALRRSEYLYRTIIENMQDVYYRTNGQGELIMLSPSAKALFGFDTLEEAYGLNVLEKVWHDPSHRKFFWETLQEHGALKNYEFQDKRKDGTPITILASSRFYVDEKGDFAGIEGILTDITDRKAMENRLQVSHSNLEAALTKLQKTQDRLVKQERLTAVGQLTDGIAHDFNNLLTGILGFAELLQRSPDTPPSMQPALRNITESGRKGADIVRQLLDFSRQNVLQLQNTNLGKCTEEFVTHLKPSLPPDIDITLSVHANNYHALTDPAQLQKVCTNLVSNALDAMPHGGQLRFNLSSDYIELARQCAICSTPIHGQWLTLAISDTGTGIPADVLPHIFEPFFTTKDIGKGRGLGLSQVFGIIAQHGGHIHVVSQVQQGSTFTIYLPPTTS